MIVRLLADKMEFENGRPKPTYKHKLLAMIDEFPALGKLEILQQSLAFVAGYGIKCYLIAQDINQLKSRKTGWELFGIEICALFGECRGNCR